MVFLNLPAAAAPDVFRLPDPIRDEGTGASDVTAVGLNDPPEVHEPAALSVPGSSDWPPLKSENPNRRVIVKLEREPTAVLKERLTAAGADSVFISKRLNDHFNLLELDHAKFKAIIARHGIEHVLLWDYYNAYNGLGLVVRAADVARLRDLPGVQEVSYDTLGSGAVSDTVYIINADEVWSMKNATNASINGEGVVVAVLDTGIDYNHKDLGGGIGPSYKVIGGYDFVNKDSDPLDDNYHGTMVAGIIAADGTIKGVAPNASLLAYKVSDETDNAWMSDTVAGLDRALDPDGVPATDDAADILCISLSWFGTPYDTVSEAVDNAYRAGALPVVAAGNSGPDIMTMRSPGGAYNALSVGATTKFDELAELSARGPVGLGHVKPELVAPGIDIFTTYLGNQYGTLTGTSAAAPHVVGAAALLKQLRPGWTAEQIRNSMVNNAHDLGEDAVAQGTGRLDVKAAADAQVLCSPDILAFETGTAGHIESTTSEKVTLNNTGAASVDINVQIETYYMADDELLPVAPEQLSGYVQPQQWSFSVPASSTLERQFSLSLPGDAKQGYYWGIITFTSAGQTLRLPFGFRHLLLDQDNGEWVVSADTAVSGKRLLASNLTVTNTAKLELTDVTLFIRSAEDGLSLIDIQQSSELVLTDCTIAAYNPSIYYNFSASGKVDISHSSLSGMWGIYDTPYPGGINIYADGSRVTNSSVFRCYTNAIFMESVTDIVIADNYLHHNGGEGILAWGADDVRFVRNNCSRNWWDGIGITLTEGVILDNEIHYNSYDGLWINASSPYIANNNVTYSGYWMKHQDASGIKFQRNSRAVLENNNFHNSKYFGFFINASSPVVWNTSITNSYDHDINMIQFEGNASGPTFINSTYNSVYFAPDDFQSNITRMWFLDVTVRDDTGIPVPDTHVRLIDNREIQVAAVRTDSTGRTPTMVITQYIRSYQKTEHRTPYRLEVNKSSIAVYNYTDILLGKSRAVTVILPIPDLEILSAAHSPKTAFVNEKSTFWVNIKNNGSFAVADLELKCTVEGNLTPLAEIDIASLDAYAVKNISFTRTVTREGLVKLTFVLGTASNLLERDPDNNRFEYVLRVHGRPLAESIVIEDSHTYLHEYITFNATASAGEENITGYQFHFSDGTVTGWQENSTYRHYFSTGNYINVTFRVITASGLISNWSKPVWFQLISRLPGSGIDIDPLHGGNVKTIYRFTPSLDLDLIYDIISSYSWTFGDGGFDDNRTPRHEYSDDGTYNVTLKIRYATDGTTYLFWKKLVVANMAPEAGFFASSIHILLGDEVTFDASTTTDADDPKEKLTFSWDFGDGSTETGMVVTHTYTVADVYFVTLVVNDDNNQSSQKILEVVVTDTGSDDGGAGTGSLSGVTLALMIIGSLVAVLVIVTAVFFMVKGKKPPEDEEEQEIEE